MVSNSDIELNKKKLDLMINKIYHMERKNAKTEEYNNPEMVAKIRKVIVEEINKNT